MPNPEIKTRLLAILAQLDTLHDDAAELSEKADDEAAARATKTSRSRSRTR
jgi:hypothetical protein